MKKVGVTGGTGFIGQYLLRESSGEYEFVVLTSGKSQKNVYEAPNIKYVEGEYSYNSLIAVFRGCDAIVHLGAKRSDAESEKGFYNYFDNLSFSEYVFSAARDLGITNIINISSTAVYDEPLKAPFSEENAVSPISFYGVSKRAIELIAEIYNKKHNMNIKSRRLAQVIGEGERPGYILTVFKERCVSGLPLYVYGEGKSGKEYIYVKDVVSAIITAIGCPERRGIYNIGSGTFTTNKQLAEMFCSAFENKAGFELLTDKQEVVKDYYMDVRRAKDELGFSCKYSLQDALSDLKLEMGNALSYE